jgi:hypothetical protein
MTYVSSLPSALVPVHATSPTVSGSAIPNPLIASPFTRGARRDGIVSFASVPKARIILEPKVRGRIDCLQPGSTLQNSYDMEGMLEATESMSSMRFFDTDTNKSIFTGLVSSG